MTLPRILVLDDLTGWSKSDRKVMCKNLALIDVTEGSSVDDESGHLAQAVFHPAQTRINNYVKNDIDEALRVIATNWGSEAKQPWSLILLDLQFDQGRVSDGPIDPDLNWPDNADREFGLRILKTLAERWPDPDNPGRTALPIVALSTSPRERLEDELNNLGNLGYLQRGRESSSGSANSLRQQFAEHLFHFGLLEDGPLPSTDESGRVTRITRHERIIGCSLPMLRALREARKAANASGPCLILGPTGSGKERLARYIHDFSARVSKAFVAVNCAAIPETLIESELFGYTARSGINNADPRGKAGSFEQAHGGTLFLDEIGHMAGPSQTKLLRVLQEGEIQRLGATTTTKVDVRVIAATNKDLQAAVRDNRFHDDLLSRLKGFVIQVPTLGERPADIGRLFNFFLEKETKKLDGAIWPKRVNPSVYENLERMSWDDGNVRQLEKLTATVASNRRFSAAITPNDLPREVREMPAEESNAPLREESTPTSTDLITFSELVRLLREAPISKSQRDLHGSLALIQEAYGELVERLLETALAETTTMSGDLKPTTAVKLLLDREKMSAPEAASFLLSVAKLFPLKPDKNSHLEKALAWAVSRRRASSRDIQ